MMYSETSQANSRDWLRGDESVRFLAGNYLESTTLSISESYLIYKSDLHVELKQWDLLSDEALAEFEKSL